MCVDNCVIFNWLQYMGWSRYFNRWIDLHTSHRAKT